MKNLYMNQKSWSTLFTVCCAFVLLFGTSVNAQTAFGPFNSTGVVDLTPVDDAYDGTLGSMASSSITVSGVTGDQVVDISADLALTHTWEGDLVVKLQNPDGDVLTLFSRPGLGEGVDDGTGCCGNNSQMDGSVLIFSDAGSTDGELIGDFGEQNAGENVCSEDLLCDYFPSPGITSESATSFADFFGGTINGTWTLYVGDAGSGDFGTIESWALNIVTASPVITVFKTVALEDGNGDCSDDAEPPLFQSSLEVNSGDDVCYFYTAFNTGDVAFGIHDVTDDILGPLATELAFNLDTAAGVYLAIGPVNITENVVNTVTWIAYNAGPTDEATGTATAVVTIAGAAPVNDNVCDALPLSAGLVLNPGGLSENATVELGEPVPNPTGCETQDSWCDFENGLDNSVWFTFVAPASGSVTINTDGSYDTQIAVYEAADCLSILSEGATLLAANDDNPNYQFTQFSSLVDVNCLMPGQTYYLQIDGYDGSFGDLYVELIENPGDAVSATVSGGGIACDGGTADVQIDLTGVGPWDVIVLVDGANPSTQTGVATSPLVLTLSNAGTYTIESVTDANGCSAVGQGSAVVTLGTSPTASLTSFQDPAGLDVDFTDASSEGPTSWAWDFGDGNTSTSQNPTHTYATGGTYTVCLIATNDCGSSTQVCEQVVVNQPVVVNDDACDALPIACGDALDGSTNFANYDASVTTAGRGVWYVFEGNGQDVTMSTCGAATFDTEITVQTGADCNSLTTLTSNDDFTGCTGFTSQVTFYAEFGTSYYIHVAHYSNTIGTTGDFTLSASCSCPTALDAGTLTADVTPVCLDANGEADLSATQGSAPQVPAGYTVTYVLTSGGSNYIIEAINTTPDFTITEGGEYTIHTLVSTGTLDLSGVVFGTTAATDVLAIVSADDNICAALDVAGSGSIIVNAPGAGTITADANPNCLDNGSATISATPDGNQVVPTGFVTIYALTDADNNLEILQTSATPSFTVTAAGNYVIHTFVYDPNELDPSLLPPGTTGGDVAVLLVENGGTVCASLDVAGAPISVDPSCGPENDLCGDAIAIACGGSVTGSTEFATSDASAVDCNSGRIGVWYVFTGTGDNLAVSTSNAGTDYDTYLGISESCGGPCVASNDDDPNGGLTSLIDGFPTVSGQDYYIYVSGFSTEVGNYELSVTCTTPPTPPANDNVCDAIGLSMGANGPYDVTAATAESGEPVPPAGTESSTCESQDGWCSFELAIQNSVWFTFVAPASGTITVNTDDSYDTQVAIYEAASCQDVTNGGATLLGANDDNPDAIITSFSSELTVCGLTPGAMYYLQVDGYEGAEGPLNIDLSEPLVADWTSSATNLDVDFTDASSAAGSIVSWDWDFGDGNVSTDQNPSHSYAAANTYTVCLTVTDDAGCSTTYCEDVTVTDIPTSIAEAVENGMEVFPNPSNGEFVVAIRGVEADVQIIVMDVTGRQVYNEGVALSGNFRKDVNLGSVAKGSYILQIATTEGVVNRKIQVH